MARLKIYPVLLLIVCCSVSFQESDIQINKEEQLERQQEEIEEIVKEELELDDEGDEVQAALKDLLPDDTGENHEEEEETDITYEDDQHAKSGDWKMVYISSFVMGGWVIYFIWKKKETRLNQESEVPSQDQLREIRLRSLQKLSGQEMGQERGVKTSAAGDTTKDTKPTVETSKTIKAKPVETKCKQEGSKINDNEIGTKQAANQSERKEKIAKKRPEKQEDVTKREKLEGKAKTPEAQSQKSMSLEDKLLDVLQNIFSIEIEMKVDESDKWNMDTFKVKVTDLPIKQTDLMEEKCQVLFARRLTRERLGKMKFCITCWENCQMCLDRYKKDTEVVEFINSMKQICVHTILNQLKVAREDILEEDDFWSEFTDTSKSDQNEFGEFLTRLSGWTEDGVGISEPLLTDLIASAKESKESQTGLCHCIKVGGSILQSTKRMDEIQLQHSAIIRGIEILMAQPGMVDILSSVLVKELKESTTTVGGFFEHDTVFGMILGLTSIPRSFIEGSQLESESNAPWVQLKGFPRVTETEIKHLEAKIAEVIERPRAAVFNVLKKMMKSHREAALGWIAAVLTNNELRTSVTPQVQVMSKSDKQLACSDGFMVNLCSILLDFCLPICNNTEKLCKIDPFYSSSRKCRLNYDFETCLAHGQIVMEGNDAEAPTPDTETADVYNSFITEIFFITSRAMNVGFHPALSHFHKSTMIFLQQQKMSDDQGIIATWKTRELLFNLRWMCCLHEKEFLVKGTKFYLAYAQWITMLINDCEKLNEESPQEIEMKQRKILSKIPEYGVKDMAQWFQFIAKEGTRIHHNILANIDVYPFMDCCVKLLCREDLLPGPIPAYRITQALLAFVQTSKRAQSSSRSFGGWESITDLAALVLSNSTVQRLLGPALVQIYTKVDVVEGLDVDKEDFDKYGARADISRLLQQLWESQESRVSVIKMCGSKQFQDFLGAILDTLLYQLHDSLSRISNVKKLQAAKDDENSWMSLSLQERHNKTQVLMNEERVAQGFMHLATETLGLIDLLTKSEDVSRCFTKPPLAKRAASTFMGFLDALCGPKASELKVKDMDKYNFNPKRLLSQIIELLLRIVLEDVSKQEGFLVNLALDPDYNEAALQKALTVMKEKVICGEEVAQEFEETLKQVHQLRSEHSATMQSSDEKADWQNEIDKITIDGELLEKNYKENMEAHQYTNYDLLEYHSFQSNAANQTVEPRSQKAKALMKEMKQWNDILPIHPNAAIFVCQDEERMDVVRAMVTGPKDTPYSLGCFIFDVYFPSNYPNIPPMVKLITTGNGNVRFNPNLYADGKVCLSLLGTFHSGDSSQKWQPGKSSLYQVLVSIQSMILISDPVFNEPGYEGMKGTEEGEEKSIEYNSKLRLWTVRHAILGQLKNPTAGFEDAIKAHFKVQKEAVLAQCSHWIHQCTDKESEKKLLHEVEELRKEFEKVTDSGV